MTPEEERDCDERLRRAVLTLWQTRIVRGTRLNVIDEVAERPVLLRLHLPARAAASLCARSRTRSPPPTPPGGDVELPSFLRMGSWIGGDRDGNPVRHRRGAAPALRRQSERALSFYLDELHELGAELSLHTRLVSVLRRAGGAGGALARPLAASPGGTLSPRHLRHLCAARRHRPRARPCRGPRRAVGDALPYAEPRPRSSPT